MGQERNLIEIKEKIPSAIKRYEGKGTKGNVVITVDERRCKVCNICVVYCPGKVLKLELETVVVVNISGCNACMRCELMCPDFAIYVDEVENG